MIAEQTAPSLKSKLRFLTPYAFLFPALAVLLVFFFIPVAQALYLSFTEYSIVTPPKWIGIANYERLWHDEVFWKTLGNSLLYLLGVVPPLVILPIFIAILVNRPLRGVGFFRAAYYLPVVISMVVAGIAWKWIYAENGVLNYLMISSGILDKPLSWLTEPNLALIAVMAVTVWKGLGYYMVIYLAGLQAIPDDLYEACRIDGASSWQQIWHVTIPLLMPSISLVAVVSSISALKVFTEIYVMTSGGPLNSSNVLAYYLYEQAFGENLNLGYACALGVALFIVIFAFSLLNLRSFEKGGVQS